MLRFHRLGHVDKRTVKVNLKFTQTVANKSLVFKITIWILMEKVFGLYFPSQNLEGTYRATFRDGNLKTKIYPCLNRDGNNFPSLFRDGNYFPSLFRDRNYFPSLKLETKKIFRLHLETKKYSVLKFGGKISRYF